MAELQNAIDQEQKIAYLRSDLEKSEQILASAEHELADNLRKAKQQQYRWNKRLSEINELTTELVQRLDMVMPSSMIPRVRDWDFIKEFKGTNHHSFVQLIIEATDKLEKEDPAAQDWQNSINGALSFDEIREIVRDRDRLIALNAQKTDILRKMERYPNKQASQQKDLIATRDEKLHKRDEIAKKFNEAIKKRATDIITSIGVDANGKPVLLQGDDNIAKREAMKMLDDLEEKNNVDIKLHKQKGTMYRGKVTVPPHSTIEIPLDDLISNAMETAKKNDAAIASVKELSFANNKLGLKNAKNAELTRQAMVQSGALRREADYTPEQLIEWGKTRAQGNTMPKGSPAQIYTMQFIEKADIIGNTIEVICDQVQKGKWVDNHAQMQIAFRAGFRCPQRTGVKVLRHIKDTVYMVHFLQYDVVTDIALQVPSEPKIRGQINTQYNKYKILSCLPWHPNWTPVFERSGKIVPADVCSNSKYDVNDAIKFHRKLMDALPALPSIVPDIAMDMIGLPKDPTSATAIALGD